MTNNERNIYADMSSEQLHHLLDTVRADITNILRGTHISDSIPPSELSELDNIRMVVLDEINKRKQR